MTLILAYELGLMLTGLLGFLSVLLGGEMPLWSWLTLLAPLVTFWRGQARPVPTWVGTLVGLLGVMGGVWSFASRGVEALVLASALALMGLTAARLLTRQTLAHNLQGLLLALLLVFAGTILHTQITYAVVFVLFSVTVVGALSCHGLVQAAHTRPDEVGSLAYTLRRRDVVTPRFILVTSALAVLLLFCSALLFVAFPRFGLGAFGLVRRGPSGLPTTISLVGDPRAAGGGEVLARVRGLSRAEFYRGLYLRGPVYDELGRDGFSDSGRADTLPRVPTGGLAQLGGRFSYEIFMQPIAGAVLLTLGPVLDVRILAGGTPNPSSSAYLMRLGFEDGLRASRSLSGPIRYRVVGTMARQNEVLPPATTKLSEEDQQRLTRGLAPYLALSADLDPRIPFLARRAVGDATSVDAKVERIRRFLLDNFHYSLKQENGRKADPLAGFLFEDRAGHCEYFATAFAVMLRAIGVPSRVVGGFQGGLWDDDGDVVVFTHGNAHAWIEWHRPGMGWVADDATPANSEPPGELIGLAALLERVRRGWDDYIVEFNLQQQVALMDRLQQAMRGPSAAWEPGSGARAQLLMVFGGLLALAGVSVATWRFRRRRRRRHPKVGKLTRELLLALGKARGQPVAVQETCREVLCELTQQPPASLEPRELARLTQAVATYESLRFGPAMPEAPPHRRSV